MTGDLFAPSIYGTILADPPWMERGGGKIKRGADRHYPLMHTRDIAAMPVGRLAAADAHLYLWVTNNFLPDGLEVMAAWGFRYVTNRVWVKDRVGLGQYFRMRHELLLFGVRGRPGYREIDGVRQQAESVIEAPRARHSAKPASVRGDIARMSPGPYLEVFAREKAPGWDVYGNEVASDVDMAGIA